MEGDLAHIGAGLAAIGSGAAAIGVGTRCRQLLGWRIAQPIRCCCADSNTVHRHRVRRSTGHLCIPRVPSVDVRSLSRLI